MTLEEQQKQLEKTAESLLKQVTEQKKELENHLAASNPTLLREAQVIFSKAASGEMSLKEIEDWYKKHQK